MKSLNRAQIIGNLTRDPELRTVGAGTSVTSFGVATNRSYTDRDGQRRDEVEYHNVVVWAKLAEICNQYLHKGDKVYFEGRLQTREWEGQDGTKRRTTEIVAENMIMLGGRPSSGSVAPVSPLAPSRPAPPTDEMPTIDYDEPVGNTPQPTEPGVTEEDVRVEEIPF